MKYRTKLKISSNSKIDNRFYVYYHVNSNNEIFYIGKGYYNRAYQTNSRNKDWKAVAKSCENGYGVCFFALGLTDRESLELEKKLIKEAFRIGLPLTNKTLGGEGVSKKMDKKKLNDFRKKYGKPVYCYQTGKIYDSSTQAAEELNLKDSHVRYVCNKKSLQAKGYEFDFIENVNITELNKLKKKAKNTKSPIKVICEQTGEIFNSLRQASTKMNLEPTHIRRHINGELSNIKGYTFKLYKKGDCKIIKPMVKTKVRKIKCITNGKVYRTLTEASNDLNVDSRMIVKVCKGINKSTKNLEFKYEE